MLVGARGIKKIVDQSFFDERRSFLIEQTSVNEVKRN